MRDFEYWFEMGWVGWEIEVGFSWSLDLDCCYEDSLFLVLVEYGVERWRVFVVKFWFIVVVEGGLGRVEFVRGSILDMRFYIWRRWMWMWWWNDEVMLICDGGRDKFKVVVDLLFFEEKGFLGFFDDKINYICFIY